MKVVYVAGPFRARTPWEIEQNIRRAESVALEVWQLGAVALCPHPMTRFYQNAPGTTDELWLEGTLELLRRADALLVCGRWEGSIGSMREIEEARARELPMFAELKLLEHWLRGDGQ